MKKMFFIGFFLISLIFISACSLSNTTPEEISNAAVVCNEPYIRLGTGCCLDANGNSICDNDESLIQPGGFDIEDIPQGIITDEVQNDVPFNEIRFNTIDFDTIDYTPNNRFFGGDNLIKFKLGFVHEDVNPLIGNDLENIKVKLLIDGIDYSEEIPIPNYKSLHVQSITE